MSFFSNSQHRLVYEIPIRTSQTINISFFREWDKNKYHFLLPKSNKVEINEQVFPLKTIVTKKKFTIIYGSNNVKLNIYQMCSSKKNKCWKVITVP